MLTLEEREQYARRIAEINQQLRTSAEENIPGAGVPYELSKEKEGFEVIASQHGLDSHAGDVGCVKRTLGRVSSPAILVGHSYGGSVITAAGTDPRVAALVYLAHLPRMPTRQHKACKKSSRKLIFSPVSRLQTDAFG